MEKKPYLFRFASPCCSPGRNIPNPEYFYDNSTDLVRWSGITPNPPAIELSEVIGLPTKKADIEKGEDSKDRRMW